MENGSVSTSPPLSPEVVAPPPSADGQERWVAITGDIAEVTAPRHVAERPSRRPSLAPRHSWWERLRGVIGAVFVLGALLATVWVVASKTVNLPEHLGEARTIERAATEIAPLIVLEPIVIESGDGDEAETPASRAVAH